MRSGKYCSFSTKDRKKEMEDFKKTGKHPEIEEIRARAAAETLHPMPDVDLARPRTFMEFTVGGQMIGVPRQPHGLMFESACMCLRANVRHVFHVPSVHAHTFMQSAVRVEL